MTYPALPTFPASTNTAHADLLDIKAGEHFVLGGYEHRATCDAAYDAERGRLTIPSVRRHPGAPSGWEVATVMEFTN